VGRPKTRVRFDLDSLWENRGSDRDPGWFGSPAALVTWLNKAASGPPLARRIAGRVTVLLEQMLFWEDERKNGHLWDYPLAKFQPSQHMFEVELLPPNTIDDSRWRLLLSCSPLELEPYDSREVRISWPGDGPHGLDPELTSLTIILRLALAGKLGRIRRCETCRRWFLTKNDVRVRTCTRRCTEERRKSSPERKAQLKQGKKRERDRLKNEDEQFEQEQNKRGFVRPKSHRAER
jgi:hypothetical protein